MWQTDEWEGLDDQTESNFQSSHCLQVPVTSCLRWKVIWHFFTSNLPFKLKDCVAIIAELLQWYMDLYYGMHTSLSDYIHEKCSQQNVTFHLTFTHLSTRPCWLVGSWLITAVHCTLNSEGYVTKNSFLLCSTSFCTVHVQTQYIRNHIRIQAQVRIIWMFWLRY